MTCRAIEWLSYPLPIKISLTESGNRSRPLFAHIWDSLPRCSRASGAADYKSDMGIFAEFNSCKSFENIVSILYSYVWAQARELMLGTLNGKLSKSSEKKIAEENLRRLSLTTWTFAYGFQIVCKDIPDFSGFRLNMLISPRAMTTINRLLLVVVSTCVTSFSPLNIDDTA